MWWVALIFYNIKYFNTLHSVLQIYFTALFPIGLKPRSKLFSHLQSRFVISLTPSSQIWFEVRLSSSKYMKLALFKWTILEKPIRPHEIYNYRMNFSWVNFEIKVAVIKFVHIELINLWLLIKSITKIQAKSAAAFLNHGISSNL